MAAGKAPKGGVVSHVNGQFYAGGEFTPDHGRYCGQGKNRVPVAEFEQVRERVQATGHSLEYDEVTGDFIVYDPPHRLARPGDRCNVRFRARGLGTVAKVF